MPGESNGLLGHFSEACSLSRDYNCLYPSTAITLFSTLDISVGESGDRLTHPDDEDLSGPVGKLPNPKDRKKMATPFSLTSLSCANDPGQSGDLEPMKESEHTSPLPRRHFRGRVWWSSHSCVQGPGTAHRANTITSRARYTVRTFYIRLRAPPRPKLYSYTTPAASTLCFLWLLPLCTAATPPPGPPHPALTPTMSASASCPGSGPVHTLYHLPTPPLAPLSLPLPPSLVPRVNVNVHRPARSHLATARLAAPPRRCHPQRGRRRQPQRPQREPKTVFHAPVGDALAGQLIVP
ncbi:hypothetical protein B0H13DRAFT_1918196 [Mycena leptocephala]|nr:hypothetical protein B0H13DRAFT_1918196 [Mycena leptocephala]